VVKIASIGLAVVTLAMAAASAHAGHETIGPLIGTPGAPHWARSSQQQSSDTLMQHNSALAYADYAEGAGPPRKICGHVGGPKVGTWTCQ
jgi:hypothetical protein